MTSDQQMSMSGLKSFVSKWDYQPNSLECIYLNKSERHFG